MYGENRLDDAKRFIKAWMSDHIAHFAPRLYVKLTAQTGRGAAEESVQQIADYFRKCFYEYFQVLNVDQGKIQDFLKNKKILEYGPGNITGIGLLMHAYGAEQVICVDRFPLVSMTQKNIDVLRNLMDGLEGKERIRAMHAFNEAGNPASGFAGHGIRYLVRKSGLSGLAKNVDIIISRAVLEHVNDLDATFNDMHNALLDTGVAIHQVDLKSHGLHRKNPLDFLTWPPRLWSLMYGHKGVPNRWRVDKYRQVIADQGFKLAALFPTVLADATDMAAVRPHLAAPFRAVSDEDLSWLGFWVVINKAEGKSAYPSHS
jgi:SAM-dependent methyltransferase